jgi:hypothetical protein
MLRLISLVAWAAALAAVALLVALRGGPLASNLRLIEGDLHVHQYACDVEREGCRWPEQAELDVDGETVPLNIDRRLFAGVCAEPAVVPRVRAQSDFRTGDQEAKLFRAEIDCGDGFKPFRRFVRSEPPSTPRS